jgi:hypothetical protein
MASVSTVSEEKVKGAPSVRTSTPGAIIKINGEVVYRTGDVLNLDDDTPFEVLLGQKLWTVDSMDALEARTNRGQPNLRIPERVCKLIQDDLMANNPFCQTYVWAAEKIRELERIAIARALAQGREVVMPKMELILLNNREAAEAGILNDHIHPHRSENSAFHEAVSLS